MKNSPARKVCGRNAVAAIGPEARAAPEAVARAGMVPAVAAVVALAVATAVRVPVVPVAALVVAVRVRVAAAVVMIAVAVTVRIPNAVRRRCWPRCRC